MARRNDPETDGDTLLKLISELLGLIGHQAAGDTLALMNEAGLTMPQMMVLHLLRYARRGVPILRLVEILHLSTSATSHLVDKLVGMGLVDRSEDPTDRRKRLVAITPEGEALLVKLYRARAEEFRRALAPVDPELQMQLIEVFRRVNAKLRRSAPSLAQSDSPDAPQAERGPLARGSEDGGCG